MDLSVEAQGIKDILTQFPNEEIMIFLPEQATRDAMAAGLALFLSFSQHGRKVKIAYPRQPTVAWSNLIGINKITQKVSSKNFVISLDYVEGSIEKVSYNIEGDKFNLVIEPKPESQQLFNEKNVHYSYGGLNAGIMVTIQAPTVESLGKFYSDNEKFFTEKPVITVDNNPQHKQYGKINVVRPAASITEVMAQLIQAAQLPLTEDIATNLYDGLTSGSRNFTAPQVTPDTLELAAALLRKGAKRPQPVFPRSPEEMPFREFVSGAGEEEKQLPPDWLKPKIFKGSGGMV